MESINHIGQQIGNYRLASEINSGSFGSVYLAEHLHLKGRQVAIKLLHTYLGSQAEREQFTQEAQFLAQLEHPSILPLLDFGFSEDQPYLITRYAAGGSLRQRLKQQRRFPLDQALMILQQVAQALQYAHERHIIHRDLKPENILFNERGEALLADFGIAVMLSTASIKHLTVITGTPPYMAPEQFKGTISKEGDQYALGCIAYELLTGQPPFRAPDFVSMGFQHLTEPPTPPSQLNTHISPSIEAALLKSLAKQRTERHADISTFIAALSEIFTQLTTTGVTSPQPASDALLPTQQARAWTKEQWLEQGNAYYDEQRYAEALEAYEHTLRFDPDNAPAYVGKGDTLDELRRYGEALEAYEQAIRLDPQSVLAYNNKGNTLCNLQRYEEALAAYEQTIHLDPQFTLAYYNKGVALEDLHRYGEVLEACEQTIRLDPQFTLAYYNKGVALECLQRYEEALEAYDQTIRLDPDYTRAYYNKGVTLGGLQRYWEALAAYEQALRLDPNDADIYTNQGDALKALGRKKEARTAYARAKALRS